jgi:hypothetical protein
MTTATKTPTLIYEFDFEKLISWVQEDLIDEEQSDGEVSGTQRVRSSGQNEKRKSM